MHIRKITYVAIKFMFVYAKCIFMATYVLVGTKRETLQTLKDGVPTQKYPVSDALALVIISEVFTVFPVVLVTKFPC